MDPLLESFARQCRDRPAVQAIWSRAERRCLTFETLDRRALAWQEQLAGDPRPIALATGNRTAFVELYVALRRLGLTVVVMDSGGAPAERIELCKRLGIARLLQPAQDGEGRGEALPDGLEMAAIATSVTEPPAETALVKLTSGSTGEPLAACFTAASLAAGIAQIAEGMEITARDRVLMALPLSHSYGFDNGVLSLLAVGTPLVLEPSVYPADLLRATKKAEVTFWPLVPPLVRSLARARWPDSTTVRRVICAGGVLPPEFARDFHGTTGLHVHNFYGSTETGGIAFERHPGTPEAAGTVGHPLPGVEVTFDKAGRVQVDSAANLVGHFGRDSVAHSQRVITGDLGQLTPEGRLQLTGRTADLLNIGGRRVAAAEAEAALRALEGVQDAAVVGVEDAMRGDRAVAFLVADRWPVPVAALPARLRPREVRRLDELPHNARGKLDRQKLRQMARRANLVDRRP